VSESRPVAEEPATGQAVPGQAVPGKVVPAEDQAGQRRIGVYVCRCGGNISDYVDVPAVVEAVSAEPGVVIARQAMFTCSDATQQEIIEDITGQCLDGLVVASCSPKLHQLTFRGVAERAGLNPYQYTQVNLREQCSWTHTDDPAGATAKAVSLVRAGIARTRLSEPLVPASVEVTRAVLVVGGGVAGMRAAIGLADIGLAVYLVEREPALGGQVAGLGALFPAGESGHDLAQRLRAEIGRRPLITVLTSAELTGKSGSYGNYRAEVRVWRRSTNPGAPTLTGELAETALASDSEPAGASEVIHLDVGHIIVATGFDSYQPTAGEYGYGIDGVVTLPEFLRLLDESEGPLFYQGRPVGSVAYIYCVGSRDAGHPWCSKFCCTAAVHASLLASGRGGPDGVRQYHLYRDLRTYGKNELLLSESRERGSVYLKFDADTPPGVASDGGRLTVTVRDLLTGGAELAIPADLVVLVTGAVPRHNGGLDRVLKVPAGPDGFCNEIHPKLRPTETVVDGVLIAGGCQGPKTVAESAASGLAAATQAAAALKRGVAELDPQVAVVNTGLCNGCGACVEHCPFGAISMVTSGDGAAGCEPQPEAIVDPAVCKGCGGCVPGCPADAIDLLGYTDAQVRAAIDGLLEGAAS
jgi:heterodisulfide reductase subunit A2